MVGGRWRKGLGRPGIVRHVIHIDHMRSPGRFHIQDVEIVLVVVSTIHFIVVGEGGERRGERGSIGLLDATFGYGYRLVIGEHVDMLLTGPESTAVAYRIAVRADIADLGKVLISRPVERVAGVVEADPEKIFLFRGKN